MPKRQKIALCIVSPVLFALGLGALLVVAGLVFGEPSSTDPQPVPASRQPDSSDLMPGPIRTPEPTQTIGTVTPTATTTPTLAEETENVMDTMTATEAAKTEHIPYNTLLIQTGEALQRYAKEFAVGGSLTLEDCYEVYKVTDLMYWRAMQEEDHDTAANMLDIQFDMEWEAGCPRIEHWPEFN